MLFKVDSVKLVSVCFGLIMVVMAFSGCGGDGLDMSTPYSTVEGYVKAVCAGDAGKMAEYRGIEGEVEVESTLMDGVKARPGDLEIIVLSRKGTKATVKASWQVVVEANGMEFPGEKQCSTYDLEEWDGGWMILRERDGCEQSNDTDVAPVVTPEPSPTPEPVSTATPGETPAGWVPDVSPVSGGTGHLPLIFSTGAILLSDNFTDTDNWLLFSDYGGVAYVYERRLHVQDRATTKGPEICLAGHSFGDIILEVDVQLINGNWQNWCVIACRVDRWGDGYHFLISPDGHYAIRKQYNRTERVYLADLGFSRYINTGPDAMNHVRVDCAGEVLQLWVNGRPLVRVQDDSFGYGNVGLGVDTPTGGPGAEMAYDNILIYDVMK